MADLDRNIEIKDAIQELLRHESLRYSEIMLRFNIPNQSMKNFITSLKLLNIIEYDPNYPATKRGTGKFRTVADSIPYSEKLLKARNARKTSREATIIAQTEVSPYATMTCNSNKYHTRPAQRPSSSAWAGYGSLA